MNEMKTCVCEWCVNPRDTMMIEIVSFIVNSMREIVLFIFLSISNKQKYKKVEIKEN
jgi:hypothetical protein